jgi:hypothetical protein
MRRDGGPALRTRPLTPPRRRHHLRQRLVRLTTTRPCLASHHTLVNPLGDNILIAKHIGQEGQERDGGAMNILHPRHAFPSQLCTYVVCVCAWLSAALAHGKEIPYLVV